MDVAMLNRFLGGSPLAVLVRLALLSLVVGALMTWLGVDVPRLFAWAERTAADLWATGFGALRELGRYALTGAALVLPIWFLTRLFSLGDMRRNTEGRWQLPGAPPERAGTEGSE